MLAERKTPSHILYVLLIITCFIGVLFSKEVIPSEATRIVLLGLLASLVVGIIFNAIVKESSLPFLQSEKITLGGSIGAFVITLGIFLYAQHEMSNVTKERDEKVAENKILSGDIKILNNELTTAHKNYFNLNEKNGIHSSYAQAIPNLFSSSPSRVPLELFLEVGCVRTIQPDDFKFTGVNLGDEGANLVGSFDSFGNKIKLKESKGTFYAHIGDSFTNESKFVAEIVFDNTPILLPKLRIKFGNHNPCAAAKSLNINIDKLISRIEMLPVNSYLEVGSDVEGISGESERQRLSSSLYRFAIDNINEPDNPWLLLLGQLSKGWSPVNQDSLPTLYSYRESSSEGRKREIDHAISNAFGSLNSCMEMVPVGVSGLHDQYACLDDFSKNYPTHTLAKESEVRAIGILFDIALSSSDKKQSEKLQDIIARYDSVKVNSTEPKNRATTDSIDVFISLANFFLGRFAEATETLNKIDPYVSSTINFALLGSGTCGLPDDKFTTSIVLQSLSNIYTSFDDIGIDNQNRTEILCTAINTNLTRKEKSGYYIKVADVAIDDLDGNKAKSRWVEKVESLYNDLLDHYEVEARDFVHILQGPVNGETPELKPLVIAFGIPPSAGNAITDSDSCDLEKRLRNDGIQAFVIGGIAGTCV